jgi:hypothetical protein
MGLRDEFDSGFRDQLSHRYSTELSKLSYDITNRSSSPSSQVFLDEGIPEDSKFYWSRTIIFTIADALISYFISILFNFPLIGSVATFFVFPILIALLLFSFDYIYTTASKYFISTREKMSKPDNLIDIQQKIQDLSIALTKIIEFQNSEKELKTSKPSGEGIVRADSANSTEDCDHWKELLTAHRKALKKLELQQATLGSHFHYSQAIEIEERRKYIADLQATLNEHCRGNRTLA